MKLLAAPVLLVTLLVAMCLASSAEEPPPDDLTPHSPKCLPGCQGQFDKCVKNNPDRRAACAKSLCAFKSQCDSCGFCPRRGISAEDTISATAENVVDSHVNSVVISREESLVISHEESPPGDYSPPHPQCLPICKPRFDDGNSRGKDREFFTSILCSLTGQCDACPECDTEANIGLENIGMPDVVESVPKRADANSGFESISKPVVESALESAPESAPESIPERHPRHCFRNCDAMFQDCMNRIGTPDPEKKRKYCLRSMCGMVTMCDGCWDCRHALGAAKDTDTNMGFQTIASSTPAATNV